MKIRDEPSNFCDRFDQIIDLLLFVQTADVKCGDVLAVKGESGPEIFDFFFRNGTLFPVLNSPFLSCFGQL